jgi:hypothetical protein
MATNVRGKQDETRHFEGWTNVSLAAHLKVRSDLHLFDVKEPDIWQLARYPLDELEELHLLAHASRVRDLKPMTDGEYERALEVLNS